MARFLVCCLLAVYANGQAYLHTVNLDASTGLSPAQAWSASIQANYTSVRLILSEGYFSGQGITVNPGQRLELMGSGATTTLWDMRGLQQHIFADNATGVSVQDMTLANGNANGPQSEAANYGGCISAQSWQSGNGLSDISAHALLISHVVFRNCTAILGGAICSDGVPTLTLDTCFDHNVAGQFSGAAAVWSGAASFTCLDCSCDGNGPNNFSPDVTCNQAQCNGRNTASRVCMFGSPRCGYTATSCSSARLGCYDSLWIGEDVDFADVAVAESYVSTAVKQAYSTSVNDLINKTQGLPIIVKAIVQVAYSKVTGGSLNCTETVLKQGVTGADVQNCVNGWLLSYGESALEAAACAALTGGTLAPFCASPVFQAATGVFNNVVNHYIGKPIVKAADTVEDALANVAESAANVISSWFPFEELV